MPDLADRLCDYISGLTIAQGRLAGEPFPILPWQRRFLRGTFSQPGDSAVSVARGNGKSTLIAAIVAACVDGPLVQPMADTLVVASSFDQGKVVFGHVMAFLDPVIAKDRKRYRIADSTNKAELRDTRTRSRVRVIGSDPRRAHGLAPALAVLDEVAQWPPNIRDKMLSAIRTSRGKIPGSRVIWLGTRPDAPSHPFERALNGTGTGFALSYAADRKANPFLRSTWAQANPSLNWFPDLEAVIAAEAEDAKLDEGALASFRALRLNQGVSDTVQSALIDADAWERAESLEPPELAEDPYVLGLDLGTSAAMSAAAAYHLSGRLDAVACFPEIPSIRDRGIADNVGPLYRRMAERGELIVAGRRVSDVPALLAESLNRWGVPAAIVADRWREAELRQHLEASAFPLSDLIVRGQGFKDGGEDLRTFRTAVLRSQVMPRRSLLLRAAMAEARATGDPAGNQKLSKNTEAGRRKRAKDDAVAASILAVAEGARRFADGAESTERSFYLGMA